MSAAGTGAVGPRAFALFMSCLVFAGVFLAWPEIDLLVSGLMYTPGQGFVLSNSAFFNAVHDYIGILAWLICLSALLVWLLSWWRCLPTELSAWLSLRRRAALFLALALLLGPGLMVNTVFKDNWGRARPVHLAHFGGANQAEFTPAWIPSQQCAKNCAFVCGDASVGFGLIAFAFVTRRTRLWLGIGISFGAALGAMRIAQGGHFLSDVIFSFYVVYFTSWLLHRTMYRHSPAPVTKA